MKAVTLLIVALSLSLSTAGTVGAGTVYRVGPGCTYSTIQDAVDAIPANGSGILRIRHGSYNESVTIVNKQVQLIGGHTSCAASGPSPTGLSAIDAGGTGTPALAFMVTNGTRELRVTNVNLANGTGVFAPFVPFPGGGLSVWTNPDRTANVILDNSSVFDNSSEHMGGGIALIGDGDGLLVLRNNSRVFGNQVTGDTPHGGGLYCEGNYHTIMQGGSINTNTAGSPDGNLARGGGLYLDGCSMIWFSHEKTAPSSDDASLRHNTAHGEGGGLYATGGAFVHLVGADDTGAGTPASSRPLRIHDNQAIDDGASGIVGFGGAIYAIGAGTEVTVDRGWIYNHDVPRNGGALHVSDGAIVNIERSDEVCHSPRNCSRMFENTASGVGGAVYVADAEVNIRRTKLENNRVAALSSSPLYVADGGDLTLSDSLMSGDVDSGYAITAFNSSDAAPAASVGIFRSTVADTGAQLAVFRLVGNNAFLTIFDSIIHEAGGGDMVAVIGGGSPTVAGDCIVWHDDALIALGASGRTEAADPLFADRENGLYYLQPGSPAINYCDVAPPAPGVDLDWNPRGNLHSGQPAVHGPYDLGAYELPLDIFEDRFEQP